MKNKFKPLRIEDIMDAIDKDSSNELPANDLPTEFEPLINGMDEDGKFAAAKLIVNEKSRETAKKVFLSTFEGITVEQIMYRINQRNGG